MNGLVAALMGRSHDEAKLRARLHALTALFFLLAVLVGSAFAAMYLRMHDIDRHRDAEATAVSHSASLEEKLSLSLSSTYALAAVLQQNGGEIDNFESLAPEMLRLYGGISSLQLARKGVVSDVVPFVGNSQAIGHDLLADKARNKEARHAVQTKKLTLAGPFELMQGGTGIVGRLPIFLAASDEQEEFWGFASAVIRIDDLLAACRLFDVTAKGYEFELAKLHPESGVDRVFARSGPDVLKNPVAHRISVPNGTWMLRIAPIDGWIGAGHIGMLVAGVLLLASLVALFSHSILKQPLLLRREVEQRTRDLADANDSLNAEITARTYAQQEVLQSNRLYSVLSHTNSAIVRMTDRDALLQEICRIVVEHGGFSLARIALRDVHGGWRWVAGRADESAQDTCEEMLTICEHYSTTVAPGATPRLSHEDAPQCDSSGLPCEHALAAGFKSQVFLQLRMDDAVAGVFNLYAREAGAFGEAQLQLLQELSEDVSFALQNIKRETARRLTEERLRKLSCAVEQSASAILITDRHGSIEYVNRWFTRLTGYTPDEVIGLNPRVLKSAETHPETHKRLWSTIGSGREWTGELHNTKKNGECYWCLETISPLKDEKGEVTHFVSVTEDISERMQSAQAIRHLALHDPLTGLPNRRLFSDRLYQATSMRQLRDRHFALLLLDLDRFKTINDTLGHDVGDALLKAVSERLQTQVHEGDTLARMGGDEFALLVFGVTQPEEAARLAGKLLELVRQPFHLHGNEFFLSTSIGITLYPGDAAEDDSLIKHADIALYRAKDLGRNNFQFFTGDMNAAIQQRLRLEGSLRNAIERGELLLHYQPQIDLCSGRIHSCETLIRWQHPKFDMISPAQFIPMAEENGMIVQIGEWVLRTACAQAKAWQVNGTPIRVAVNLSARQFQQGDLADLIGETLNEFDLPPHLLEIELTEGILMEDTSQTEAVLEKLHRMGVQISIDDFGTGYSSLSYLKRLPIQILKIDQSFVRDIHTNSDDRAIVTAIIALAHSLNLKVVAEGVETHEQSAFLRAHHCDSLQGYLFSKPIPADAVLDLLVAETTFAI